MPSEISRLAFAVAAKDAAWEKLPVVLVNLDTGEIVDIHKSAADLFGWSPQELWGQQIEVLVPEDIRPQHAVWRRDVMVPRTRLMGEGRKVHGRRKDGSLFAAHVGLTEVEAMGVPVAIGFVFDLTGALAAPSEKAKAWAAS